MRRPRWVRLPGRLSRVQREVDDEIGFHLASRIEDLRRSGLDAAAAEAAARREFGDLNAARDELAELDRRALRRSNMQHRWETLVDDVRSAARSIRRSRTFSATVVAIMAIGIAASASMFSLVDRLMLRAAPHVRDPERLAVVYHETTVPAMGRLTQVSRSFIDLQSMTAERSLYRDVGGFMRIVGVVGMGPGSREVPLTIADAGFFRVLGVQPVLGRFFTDEETAPTSAQVAVISHEMWHRDFGGRADVIGTMIDAMERRVQVIGVTPPGFRGIGIEPSELYVPLGARTWMGGDPQWVTSIGYQWIRVVVRLADGVTREAAQVRSTTTFRRVHDEDEWERTGDLFLGSVIPGRGPESAGEGRVSVVLVAGLATLWPAWRASRLDPMMVLREE